MTYVGLALATIGLGLSIHLGGSALLPAVRDVLGDALWAVMIVWVVSAIAPAAGRGTRGAVAVAICWVVEASQLYHAPTIDAVRATTAGHLVLGNAFDPRDLLAYGAGVLVAVVLEAALGRRRAGEATEIHGRAST